MNLLSIQGHNAPSFNLNKAQTSELKRQVSNLTQDHVLLINSKHRTDLIYFNEENISLEILQLWCNISGVLYKDSTKVKFFRSNGELTTLTHFFYRLQLLYRVPQWHKAYYEQLLSMWMENPKDRILVVIMKLMRQLEDLSNEHKLVLSDVEFKLIVEKFINPKRLTSPNMNIN